MQITIDANEITCSRCKATAPIVPQVLRRCESNTASSANPTVLDSAGGIWQVVTTDRPAGWTVVDSTKAQLCAECSASLKGATMDFIENKSPAPAPSPPPVANIAHTPKIEVGSPQAAPLPLVAAAPWAGPMTIPIKPVANPNVRPSVLPPVIATKQPMISSIPIPAAKSTSAQPILPPVIVTKQPMTSTIPIPAARNTFAPQAISNFGPARVTATTRMAPPPPATIANSSNPAVQAPIATPIAPAPISTNIKNQAAPAYAGPSKMAPQPTPTLASPTPIMTPTAPATTLVSGPTGVRITAPVPTMSIPTSNGVVSRPITTAPMGGGGGPSAKGPSPEQLAEFARRRPAQQDIQALPKGVIIADAPTECDVTTSESER